MAIEGDLGIWVMFGQVKGGFKPSGLKGQGNQGSEAGALTCHWCAIIHSLKNHLLSTCVVPDPVLGAEDIVGSKANETSAKETYE